ncbi:MAG: RsmD family RNA methyltransferase [Leptospiraceae bacterium]|nr:RsmD family RNA methyltransferase [Leptospiraceae bacterium]
MKKPGLRVGSGKFKRSAIPAARAHRHHQNSTSARVKEAAFQIIRNRIDIESEWIFYDLFAGSGQMGIEALSLGASHATFVELVPERLSEIQRALESLDVPHAQYTLTRARANKILPEAFAAETPCVVWADPPYTYGQVASNDPAILISLYHSAAQELPGKAPVFVMQVHEKSPVLTPEFLAANSDIEVYRYGSNCLVVIGG